MTSLGEEGDPIAFSEENLKPYIDPVRAFIQGARDSGVSDQFFAQIRAMTPEDLCEGIQGKALSNQIVLNALLIEEQDGGDVFSGKVNWLQEKIASADPTWLKTFVSAITGRETLAAGTKIKIKPTWREGAAFELHTCFNSLDLPKIAMDKEAFLSALDFCISNPGYNIA